MTTVTRSAWVVPSGGSEPTEPANDMVGWIGDSLTAQDGTAAGGNSTIGPTNILAALVQAGWSSNSVVSGLGGRKIRDGSPNPSTPTQIQTWRAGGIDPSTWVFALGNNSYADGATKWTADVNANLDDIAAGGGNYRVFLFGMTSPSFSNFNVSYYQTLQAIAAANTRPNVEVLAIDLDNSLHTGEDETGWWWDTGIHMKTAGYAWRNKLMVAQIGGPKYQGPPDDAIAYSSLSGSSFDAKLDGAGNASVSVPSGTYTCSDFSDAAGFAGMWTQSIKNIYGPVDRSAVIQMSPNTSTKASSLPPAGANQANNFNLWRLDNSPRVYGVTINGTEQGMPYYGLFYYKTTNAIINGIKTVGIPGDDAVPPGETAGVQTYQAHGTRIYWSSFVGPHIGAGTSSNSSTDLAVVDCNFDLSPDGASACAINYASTDLLYVRCNFANTTHRGINFERTSGHIILQNCTFTNVQTTIHMEVDSDNSTADVVIIDPVFEGATFQVRVANTYAGNPRTQSRDTIHLYINGVERADLLTVHA